jgi:iron complex outermembrane receptor protein
MNAASIRFCSLCGLLLLVIFSVLAAAIDAAQPSDEPPAQGSLKQLTLEQLGDVEVTTVSKEPETVWRTPAAIFVLTQEDIRRSGATSIPEVLRLVPGVEVARIDGDHWSIGIRGFGSSFSKSLLVLLDGRSVYTPLFAGVYWDVQDTVLEDIDRIEVIRGPGGTIWGSNAVDGVINIITKNASDTHGTLVSAGGGDLDEAITEVRQGGQIGNTLNYRVYAKEWTRGAELHPEDDHYDEARQLRGGFRLDWSDKSNDTFNLQGDIYTGDDGEITAAGSFNPIAEVTLAGPDHVSGGNIVTKWKHEFSDGSDFQAQAYYDRTDRNAAQYDEVRNTFDLDLLHHEKLGKRQDVLWGGGIRISPSIFTQVIPALNFIPDRMTYRLYSGFVQDEVQIIPQKLSLTLGSKFEDNSFSGFDAQPSARLLWTPTKRQTFWAAATRAVRTPSSLDTDIQLLEYLGHIPGNSLPVYLGVDGDSSFKPEELLGYEVGYRSLITPHFYVDLSGFYNQYNDLESYGSGTVSVDMTPFPYILFSEPFANGIMGTTAGVELAPDWTVTSWWQLKGSYSYLHINTEDRPGYTDTGTVNTYNHSSPTNEVTLQSLFNLPTRFESDLTFRYVSDLPAQAVPAYSTADARVGWHGPGGFELSVVGQNLLQPSHGEFGNTPGPVVEIRRTVFAKVTWTREGR